MPSYGDIVIFWDIIGPHQKLGHFFVLVRGIIFLSHLKTYLCDFILSRGSKFLGEPFMFKT